MKRLRLFLFVALVVLQVATVGNMARSREVVLDTGTKVTLATVPVDPRDLFRGDYVVLRYEISGLDLNAVDWLAENPHAGQTVWIALDTSDRIARPMAVVADPQDVSDIVIRGVVEEAWGSEVMVRYGIEEYFVPEGTGRHVEWAEDVEVVVAVSPAGTAVIDHLIIDGEHWGR